MKEIISKENENASRHPTLEYAQNEALVIAEKWQQMLEEAHISQPMICTSAAKVLETEVERYWDA